MRFRDDNQYHDSAAEAAAQSVVNAWSRDYLVNSRQLPRPGAYIDNTQDGANPPVPFGVLPHFELGGHTRTCPQDRVCVTDPGAANGSANSTSQHQEFDRRTGNMLFEDHIDADGRSSTRTRTTYDPHTHRATMREIFGAHEAQIKHIVDSPWARTDTSLTEQLTYDPRFGRIANSDVRYQDGRSEQSVFDQDTGRMISNSVRFANGATESYDLMQYGPTGRLLSQNFRYSNGETGHLRYNSSTGELLEKDLLKPDGTRVQVQYGGSSFSPHSNIVNTWHKDGSSSSVEFDDTNARPKFVTLRDNHGHSQFFAADPQTGKMQLTSRTRSEIIESEKEAELGPRIFDWLLGGQ